MFIIDHKIVLIVWENLQPRSKSLARLLYFLPNWEEFCLTSVTRLVFQGKVTLWEVVNPPNFIAVKYS